MLSYRHSFHAGNFADIIKHIVAVEILESFIKKDKAFEYIDTHSGAGIFNLQSDHALKLQEFNTGIGKLKAEDWPELARYFQIIKSINKADSQSFYPGSPLFAMSFLRPQDKAWLYELHPQDFDFLRKNTGNNRRVKVMKQDGLKGLLALLPPACRRSFVLIDPSYEVKTEYEQVFNTVNQACKKFATGIYAIWYPVVDRQKINQLEKSFIRSGIKNIQRFELGLTADSDERGMTASGMIVINPPWGLYEKMSHLLPKLVSALSDDDSAFFKCDILVAE